MFLKYNKNIFTLLRQNNHKIEKSGIILPSSEITSETFDNNIKVITMCAYMSQELKAKLAPAIKAVLNKYGVKGTISVSNHSTLVVTLTQGKLNIVDNYFDTFLHNCNYNENSEPVDRYGDVIKKPEYIQVNEYHIDSQYSGKVKDFLLELKEAMEGPEFFNNDDLMSDYFSRSHYTNITVGKYNKPYQVI